MDEVKFEKQNNGLYKLYIGRKCKGAYLTIDQVLSIIKAEDEKNAQTISRAVNN